MVAPGPSAVSNSEKILNKRWLDTKMNAAPTHHQNIRLSKTSYGGFVNIPGESGPGLWDKGQPPTVVRGLTCSHTSWQSFALYLQQEQLGPTRGEFFLDFARILPALWSALFLSFCWQHKLWVSSSCWIFFPRQLHCLPEPLPLKLSDPFVCLWYCIHVLNYVHANQSQILEGPMSCALLYLECLAALDGAWYPVRTLPHTCWMEEYVNKWRVPVHIPCTLTAYLYVWS